MPPQIATKPPSSSRRKITSPLTGKTYTYDWNSLTDPTDDDLDAIISVHEPDYKPPAPISTTINQPGLPELELPPPGKSYTDRAWDMGKAAWDVTKRSAINTGKNLLNFATSSPAMETKQAINDLNLYRTDPAAAKLRDAQEREYVNEQFRHPVKLAARNIAPNMVDLGEMAGSIYSDVRKGEGAEALGKVGAIAVPMAVGLAANRYITAPGRAAKLPDIDTASARIGGDLADIKVTPPEAWNFDKPGVRKGPEPFNVPRSQGVQAINPQTGEVTARPMTPPKMIKVKVLDSSKPRTKKGNLQYKIVEVPEGTSPDVIEMVRLGKVDPATLHVGSDFTDTNPILSHVPDRLKPEAPNVEKLRTLAEGGGKVGDTGVTTGLAGKVEKPPAGTKIAASLTADKPPVLGERKKLMNATPEAVKLWEGRGWKLKNQYRNGVSVFEYVGDSPKTGFFGRVKPGNAGPKSNIVGDTGLPDVDTSVVGDEGFPTSASAAERGPKQTTNPIAPVEGTTKGRAWYQDFMNKNPRFKSIMDPLIKWRSAGDLIKAGVREQFKHLNEFKKDRVIEFNELLKQGKFPEVRQFFDDLYNQMMDEGLELGYQKDYLQKVFEEHMAPDFGNRNKELNKKASFQHESYFDDYAQAAAAGKTPGKDIVPLLEDYAARVNKLIADNRAIKRLVNEGYLMQPDRAPQGSEFVDANLTSFGKFKADPNIRAVLENYLKNPEGFWEEVGKKQGKAANLFLSGGVIPRPLFTMHGINTTLRSFENFGFKGLGRALKYGTVPELARRDLAKANARMQWIVKEHGGSFNVRQPDTGPGFFTQPDKGILPSRMIKKGVNFFTDKIQGRFFERPMYDEMLPAMKYQAWEDLYAQGRKMGMGDKDAGAMATRFTDNTFGGANLDLLYNSKGFNTTMRNIFMAPDWLKTNIKMGKGMYDAINWRSNMSAKERLKYAATAGRIASYYAAWDLLQKGMTGKYMHDNENKFEFDGGKTAEGQDRKFKIFGGSLDYAQYPFMDIPNTIMAATSNKGAPLAMEAKYYRNRLAPLPMGIYSAFTGEDYQGRPNVFSQYDQYGNEVDRNEARLNTLGQAVSFAPPLVSAPYDYLMGRKGLEESIMRAAEMPVNYSKLPKRRGLATSFNEKPATRQLNKLGSK